MKKTSLAIACVCIMIIAIAEVFFVNLAWANPLPPIDPKITIENPQNTTYSVNTIILNFTVESNWEVFPLFYSLDKQGMEPIENLTTTSQDEVNFGGIPSVIRTTQKGNYALCNLSEGWHNITLYLITDHKISLVRSYEKGEILCSATTQFMIHTPPFPTTLVIAASVIIAVISIGLFVYFRKHKPVSKDAKQNTT